MLKKLPSLGRPQNLEMRSIGGKGFHSPTSNSLDNPFAFLNGTEELPFIPMGTIRGWMGIIPLP